MTQYNLVGIGNAIVDVISHTDDNFLQMMGIEKGIMTLVETERAQTLYGAMKDRLQTPGGSVANTIAGVGALGLSTAFIGRVNDDALGRYYAEAMEKDGTAFVNPPVAGGELPTSRSMIFVTEDGERSMNTYLGISAELGPEDVPDAAASNTEIIFLEGYLFDKPKGKDAFSAASRFTRDNGGIAGISMSDPFCVDRHRSDFLKIIEHELDYVIGNEHEIGSLFETDDTEAALDRITGMCSLVVCTRSGDGVTIIGGGKRHDIPVSRVTPVDATGAGDQFAAGFLYGLATGADLETCGRMGNLCAAEVISHLGPRPEANMLQKFRSEGFVD